MIITWANFQNSIADHESRLDKLEQQLIVSELTANEIKVKLAEIQTTLKYIEQSLTR